MASTSSDTDRSFVPPRPTPLPANPNILTAILRARKDLLSVWSRQAYLSDTMLLKVLGRQIFIANSPATVRRVMLTEGAAFHRKSPQMRRALEFLLGDGLFISDGELWKERREIVAPIVHRNQLHRFVPAMIEVTDEWSDRWRALDPGKPVDILHEMANLTAAIICRAVFGRHLAGDTANQIIEGFSRYQSDIDQMNIGYYLGADEGWPTRKTRRLRRSTKMVRDNIASIVEDHEAGRGDERSIISMLLQDSAQCPAHTHLTRDAIANEVATIFMAGHETTANTLAWAWYLLSQAPWAAKRVRDEVGEVLAAGPLTVESVANLKYTRAVIDETLRLYPPVPLLTRQSSADVEIDGNRIRKGDLVLVVPWLLHRNRKYWPRPDHFMPDRFLTGQPVNFSYVPFAIGPRICAGLAFGRTEAVICLALLADRFDLTLAPGAEIVPHCRLTLRPKYGVPMFIAPRDESAPATGVAA